jgi:hypothetical protein
VSRVTRRGLAAASAVFIATGVLFVGAAVAPSLALAGTWAQVVCTLSGQPAPIDGMVSSGQGGTATTDGCNPAAGASGGLIADVPSTSTVPTGTSATWTYSAPSGSTIAGGAVSVSLFAPDGLAYVSTPGPVADAQDVVAECSGNCAGSVAGKLTETVPIIHPGGTHIYETAECLGSCAAGGGSGGLFAQASVSSMTVELANTTTPAGDDFAGGLLANGALQGTQPITFTASETSGPGIYTVTVKVDGNAVYSGVPNTNGGECAVAGTDANSVPQFLNAQPCPTSVNASVPVDTTKFLDGTHDLSIVVADAAGNTATVFDRSITTSNNPPAPPITPPAAPPAVTKPASVNVCATGKPLKATLTMHVKALGHARLRFTGVFRSPHNCPLGSATTRPLVIAEVENGHHWQTVGATARVTPGGHYTATYGGGHQGSIGGRFSFRVVAPSTSKFERVVSRVQRTRVV